MSEREDSDRYHAKSNIAGFSSGVGIGLILAGVMALMPTQNGDWTVVLSVFGVLFTGLGYSIRRHLHTESDPDDA